MKCHRCNEPMTLYVVGDDYCRLCVREMARLVKPEPKVIPLWMRNLRAKDMTPRPAA